MSDDDPPRLKSTGETPAELVRALHALGRDELDAARLARVAEQLSASISGSGATTSWLRRLTGSKLGLSGLVLGLGALGVLGYSLAARRAAPTAAAPTATLAGTSAPAAQHPVASPASPLPATAPVPPPSREIRPAELPASPALAPVQAPPRGSSLSGRSPALAREERARATEGSRVAPQAVPAPSSAHEQPAAEPAPKSTPEPAQPSAAEREEVSTPEPARAGAPAAAPAVKTPAESPAPPAQPSEVALLQRARSLASQQPEAALRLLQEHAKRFPNGLLVPERELLVIEVLRGLGRNAEAEQRLRQFEARYPRSLHLRRLERSSPAGR